jgi:hypothetical protein
MVPEKSLREHSRFVRPRPGHCRSALKGRPPIAPGERSEPGERSQSMSALKGWKIRFNNSVWRPSRARKLCFRVRGPRASRLLPAMGSRQSRGEEADG